MWKVSRDQLINSFNNKVHIAPLAVLRMAFGAITFISIMRFILKGWVADFYITPQFYFTFYGFEWVKPLGPIGMYAVFGFMAVASLLVFLGLFYRFSIVSFFLCFSYVELIDKTNYLNHYYFISILSFLMIFVPAQRYFSLDVIRKPSLKATQVPAWTIHIFKLQLLLVYFFAGISKINYDWLIEAMPLKIWLPANVHLPVIGPLLADQWVAYFFSWFGLLYDLSIGFFLLNKSTRPVAYLVVVLFHIFTAWFFKIGMFPYFMILSTLVFFSENFHIRLITYIRSLLKLKDETATENLPLADMSFTKKRIVFGVLFTFFFLQMIIPFRYLLYPGNLYWTEEGYRFSWRVMLMEKAGTAFFYVKDPETGTKNEVMNSAYLTYAQERMMNTQPDMILQYANFLEEEYKKKGIKDPVVTVESYVTLNGSGSRLFIDSSVDLSKEEESLYTKKWVLPFNSK